MFQEYIFKEESATFKINLLIMMVSVQNTVIDDYAKDGGPGAV